MRILTISIGHLPYKELSPNSRCHWSVKHKMTKIAKEEIGWLAKERWPDDKPMMRAIISYEFHVKDRRHRDFDNLIGACKAFQDGLIEAGVIFYDDADHLEMGLASVVTDDRDETFITIQEI